MAGTTVIIHDENGNGSVNLPVAVEAEQVNLVDKELETHFQCIRALIREIHEQERNIYAVIKRYRGTILKDYGEPRRSAYLSMNSATERMFYSLDYTLEALEHQAKAMCNLSRRV